MRQRVIYTVLILSILPVFSEYLFSQEVNLISPYVELQYFKDANDIGYLQTSLTYSKNRMAIPLSGMEISFFNYGNGVNKELIDSAITDKDGIARVELKDTIKLAVDDEGMWIFGSEYSGNDTIEAGSSEITIKDVTLELILEEIDSVKTITVNAYIKENGSDLPVSGEFVMVYVPRMFSMLPVGELMLDESGTASIEFPNDLPGDSVGNITIIARFEDNYSFGNVERRETLLWGVPTSYSVPTTHRALWTKTPPRWMIYTLSVLLIGVWGHYLFAIISLLRIRIEAKRNSNMKVEI